MDKYKISKQELDDKIVELQSKLNKLSTQLEAKQTVEQKPAESKSLIRRFVENNKIITEQADNKCPKCDKISLNVSESLFGDHCYTNQNSCESCGCHWTAKYTWNKNIIRHGY